MSSLAAVARRRSAPAESGQMIIKSHEELVPQLRFPPGYHFLPTEEELIDVYLRAKIDGRKPPLDVFPDVNILEWEAGKLVEEYKGYGEKRWYFFTKREVSPSNKENEPRRKLRVAGVRASWKATGQVAEIRRSGTKDPVIGTKRVLTYHSCVAGEDGKWSMHEYVMADNPGMDQWVLCTIQLTLHWDANGGSGKKRKRRTDTSTEPKPTKRRKKTATSQAQEVQQQRQQETTPADGSADPPPLLMHEQDHRQALHEEHPMALDDTSLMIPAVAPHSYPDGDHHQLDVSMHQEIIPDDKFGVLPLMMHQQGYQTPHEEQYQLDASMAQMYAEHAGYMTNYQWSAMVPEHRRDNTMLYGQWQQQQLGYIGQLDSPIISRDHAQHQFLHQQDIEGLIGTQRFHGNVTGNSQEIVQFPHESGQIPVLRTSPDSVLGELEPLPYPGPPVENAHLYSYNSSAMAQETSYGSATGQFSSVEQVFAGDSKGGNDDLALFMNGFLSHNSNDNLIENGHGGNAGIVLPERSNQTSHNCQHGLQWRCGKQQSADMVRCLLCVPSCGSCK